MTTIRVSPNLPAMVYGVKVALTSKARSASIATLPSGERVVTSKAPPDDAQRLISEMFRATVSVQKVGQLINVKAVGW